MPVRGKKVMPGIHVLKKFRNFAKKEMEKEEIIEFLEENFKGGVFTTPSEVRITYGDNSNNFIEKKCVSCELSYTSIPKVLFAGDKKNSIVYEKFQRLVEEKRIMNTLMAKIFLDVPTLYKLHKAVEKGEILRFEHHDVILYVA